MTFCTSRLRRCFRRHWLVWALVAIGSSNGCYDGDALLKQAQATALSTTLAEIDLGVFQTTLPRSPGSNRFTTLEVHIFGTVPQARLHTVKKQLEVEEYRFRHETLSAVRQSTPRELADPELMELRNRIEKVVNKLLADGPVKDIGFYQLTLR